jgi:hypothetical protein
MHWPLNNVPGECIYETWTTLDGPRVLMRFRFINNRPDTTWYPARYQELPAIYTISQLSRVMSYTGDKPFTLAPLTHIKNDYQQPWPWTRSRCSEHWAAMVDEKDWGLGIFNQECVLFDGGLFMNGGSVDPLHASTTYLAPVMPEIIDHNITFTYQVTLMIGQLAEMRQHFNRLADRSLPDWQFKHHRQHWVLEHAQDLGFPLNDQWTIHTTQQSARLLSQLRCWQAEQAPIVELAVSWLGPDGDLGLRWITWENTTWQPQHVVRVPVTGDGKRRTIRVPLHQHADYQGLIVGLAIDTPEQATGIFSITSLRLVSQP